MKTRIIIQAIATAIIFASCEQKEKHDEQPQEVVLNLSEPPALDQTIQFAPPDVVDEEIPYYEIPPAQEKLCEAIGCEFQFENIYPKQNTEEYKKPQEQGFKRTKQTPLSTFSIDVDAASYSNIRRMVNNGQLPPPEAVRIEEIINYFTYNYPEPKGQEPFSIHTEYAKCPWNSKNTLLQIGIQGKHIQQEKLKPNNLVFLIDVSGSMDEPNKLPLLKSSFKLLVNQLRPEDKIAIVVYAGVAGIILQPTPGSEKKKIITAIEDLDAGGSTAGSEGIKTAYELAKKTFISTGNNRVILATDGDFNVGVSSDEALVKLIEEKRNQGIYLTVLGFGEGNFKDSKMEGLADKGNGNYYYIDNISEARKVLVTQMGATLHTIAKDVKLQIEFNPAFVRAYRLIGYENRIMANEDFNDDKKDAGELGAGHSVTALYEIVPANYVDFMDYSDNLKYQRSQPSLTHNEIATLKLRYKGPEKNDTISRLISKAIDTKLQDKTSESFRFVSSVAQLGLILSESKFAGNASYSSLISLAKTAQGKDEEGVRGEFVRLAESCRDLVQK